jgi:hypothetical protein
MHKARSSTVPNQAGDSIIFVCAGLQLLYVHVHIKERTLLACLCVSCFAGDSYSVIPTEVVTTVVLPPTPPPSAAKPSESKDSDAKAETSKAAPAQVTPAVAAAPAAPSAEAADTLISDYGFSKNLAPMAVEEFTGKYRWAPAGVAVPGIKTCPTTAGVEADKLPRRTHRVCMSSDVDKQCACVQMVT